MENINKELLIEKFCAYVSAKRKQALYLKLFFVSATVIIVSVLFYAYSITKHASEQILVVSTGGQFLPTETMELDQLYWKIHSYLPPSVHFKVIPQIHSKVTP